MFVPDLERSLYHLHVEFEGPANPALVKAFDRRLGMLNYLFKGAQATGTLGQTELRIMRTGWFNAITHEQIAAGMRDTQFKPTVLGPVCVCAGHLEPELDSAS
jgi:hypothetical protein